MDRARKVAFLVNTFMLMAGSLSGESRKAIAPEQILPIRLYDRAQVPAQLLDAATDETSWLFRTARIRISWQYPSIESPEDQGTDMTSAAFQQPDARPYIVIRLINRMPVNVLPDALGYSLPFARKGAHVIIFYDRLEKLAQSLNKAAYIVLGYAVAHELGHVLLGSSDHASYGLMQARWTQGTWRLASSSLLAFTPEEAECLRAGLQRFLAGEALSVRPPALSLPR